MKMALRTVAFVLATFSFSVFAQIGNYPALIGQRGATAPSACTVGQLFFDTDATAGSNILGCTAANVWTAQGGSGLTVGGAVSGGGANRILYEDASQNLATTSGFTFSGANLAVPGTVTAGSAIVSGGNVTVAADSALFWNNNNIRLYAPSGGSALSVRGSDGVATGVVLFSSTEDNGLSRISAGVIGVGTGAAGSVAGTLAATNYRVASKLSVSGTAPTISSGFGTSPTVPTNNGTAAFTINVGTGGTASSGVVAMPAATTGWLCTVSPTGAPQAAAIMYSAPTSTTSITITNYTLTTGAALAWTASTVIGVKCVGY